MDTKKLYELSEIADNILQEKDSNADIAPIIKELKSIINKFKQGSIGIAQVNTIVGDFEYNSKKIVKYITYASELGLETVIFPESALTGYPLEDILKRHPILAEENVKWLNEIAKLTTSTTAIIGFIEPSDTEDKYYNSLAIIQNGEIKNIIRKSYISEFSPFSDNKYIKPFSSSKNKKLYNNNINYSILIGEEVLQTELLETSSDIIVNCAVDTANPLNITAKNESLKNTAQKFGAPIIYVNQAGATDCITFGGGSCVYNKKGELIAKAKPFEEQFLIVNPLKGIGRIYSNQEFINSEEFSLDYENDLERTYKIIIQGIRDYFNKNGIKRACLGLSGGLDSTVCAVVLTDALGKENVFGISMPSKITSSESKNDAETLALNLGINYAEAPIKDVVETTTNVFNNIFSKVEQNWDYRYKKSYTQDNIQARARATYLWGVANEFSSCIPIATSDKSEAYMGYATINGDMSGGFAPIADITKTKLFALARWLNKNRPQKNAIPESIIKKRPGAELAIDERTGKPLIAEDALMPYEFLDEVIWRIENNHNSYKDMLHSTFLYEQKNNISKEQKKEWLDKFYTRMSRAFYKWSIMPPSIIVEKHSINKYDYKQVITSSHINYKGSSEEDIRKALEESAKI